MVFITPPDLTSLFPLHSRLGNCRKLTANETNCNLTWIFYMLEITTMSFQRFCILNWQTEIGLPSACNTCRKRLLKDKINMKRNKVKQYSLELTNIKSSYKVKLVYFISVIYVHLFKYQSGPILESKGMQGSK